MGSVGSSLGLFLVLGPPRAQWPAPLGEMVKAGQVGVEPVGSMHEVATQVAGGNGRVRGLLIDPRVVMLRDLEGVRTLARYVQVPVVMLPLGDGASPRAKEASDYGILPWKEAAPALAALLEVGREPEVVEELQREAEQPSVVVTDNRVAGSVGGADEKTVTSQAAFRYDELGSQPLVSPQELSALLGPE